MSTTNRRDIRQWRSIIARIMVVSGSRRMIRGRTHGITRIVSRQGRWRWRQHSTFAGVRYHVRRSRADRLRTSDDTGTWSVQMMRSRKTQIYAMSAARSEIQTDHSYNLVVRIRWRWWRRRHRVTASSAEVHALSFTDVVKMMMMMIAGVLHLSAKTVMKTSRRHI